MMAPEEVYQLLQYASELGLSIKTTTSTSRAVTSVQQEALESILDRLVAAVPANANREGYAQQFLSFLFRETCLYHPELLINLFPVFAMYCSNERGPGKEKKLGQPEWAASIKWSLMKNK